MSKLIQFTVHFPGLNPNSYDNLNNMKLDLNVSTPQCQSTLVQITRDFFALVYIHIRVITSFFQVFCSVFFKGHSLGHLQEWNLLHVS